MTDPKQPSIADSNGDTPARPPFTSYETELDKDVVKEAPYPQKGDYVIRDTALTGFCLRISPGSKTWIVRRKFGGRSYRHTLGHYPSMAIKEARREAEKALGIFAQGLHPSLVKKEQQEATKKQWDETHFTVAKMWSQYTGQDPKNRLRPFSEHTLKDFKRLENRLKSDPIWQIPFSDLTADDVLGAYARASKSSNPHATNGGKTTGNLYFRMLGTAAQHHIDKNLPPATPNIFQTALRKKRNKTRARSRTITAEPGALKRWWEAVMALRAKADSADKRKRSSAILADFQLLVLLWGGRKGETLALKWKDVDFKRKVVTFTDTKNGEKHLFPLSQLAESILVDLQSLHKQWAWDSDWVFATTRTGHKSMEKTHMKEPKSAMKEVADSAGVPFSTHDIRRSFSNLLVSADVNAEMQFVKMALNHSMASDVTSFNYLDKVHSLRPYYGKLDKAILKKIGVSSQETVEVDAEEYRQFQMFKAQQARKSRKTSVA
jgi:integrase